MLLINFFEYAGTAAFAISGALLGCKKHLDYLGIIFLAILTATGGGLIRDVFIGDFPPNALRHPIYINISIIAAIVTILFHRKFAYLGNIILIFDALGLGAFTALGSDMALQHQMMLPLLVITFGLLTGVGGGIIRDICANEIPLVFQKEIYALASIIGALIFYYTHQFVAGIHPLYICFAVTFMIRLLAIIYRLHLPVITNKAGEL